MRRRATSVALALLALLPALASGETPAADRVLPAIEAEPGELGAGDTQIVVRGFRIEGCTAFTAAEIDALLRPWIGTPLGTEELVAVRNALTRLYVDAGYVNSGAVVPDQDLAGGIVQLWVVEGSLERIEIQGNRYYRASVLRDRVALGVGRPLAVADLERNLALLQQDPRIERVHARLAPGERAGHAVLVVRVEEASPWALAFEVDNYAPVSFGSYEGRVSAAHENLFGRGDVLDTLLRVADGLIRVDAGYEIPVNARGTRLGLRGEYADSEVVEDPFDLLEIETDYVAGQAFVEHPLYRSATDVFSVGAAFEWRRSRTCFDVMKPVLGCDPFSFLESGADDGITEVSVLRISQDWSRRSGNQVMAARSTLNFGLPILGATEDAVADGKFFYWLGQLQWARRYEPWGVQTILRGDVQIASEPLPALERMAIGGNSSVRGYRENLLVRDQGAMASIEVRVPVWRSEGRPILELAPFFDFGWSKNKDRETAGPETISSAGIGLRWAVTSRVDAQVYWGHGFQDVPTSGDLQDDGVQFRLRWRAF